MATKGLEVSSSCWLFHSRGVNLDASTSKSHCERTRRQTYSGDSYQL
jgi:hypothetical protein